MSRSDSPIRVLHVDGDPDFAEVTATRLERDDDRLVVETATSARAGLDRVAAGGIGCVVSDYRLPDEDGIEFLKTIREDHSDLPFILYTGAGSEAVASAAISAGVTDYLRKESDGDQYGVLADRIHSVVAGASDRRDRQRHHEAIETAQEGISILDGDRFVYVNEAYADLYGYEPAELIGSHWRRLYPDEDVDEVRNEILPTLNDTGKWHGKTTGLRSDGGTFVEDHTLSMTEGGEIVCTVRDVTEREQQRKRLERTKTRLELAVEGANLGVWDWDMQTDEVRFNDKWAEMLGYELAEIEPLLDAWERRVHPEDIDAVEAALQAHIDGETPYYDTEHRMRTADGEWKWIRDIGKIVERNDDGEPVRSVGVHLDVSEQKRRELELEQEKTRLEEFTSIVSHDLRNPLNVASGRIELARDECDSEQLDHAADALDRMEELIGDLLRLAQSGRQINESEPIELEAVASDCWRTVETADATLVTRSDATIRGDPSRVGQLFENLFRNAVEHGGRDVTITVGSFERGFYVEDDGPGIPEADRDDVFEAGYSGSAEGTGFGLSIVRRVAEAHGWTVRVTDGAAGGARFEFTDVEFDAD